jgi:protein SCO1
MCAGRITVWKMGYAARWVTAFAVAATIFPSLAGCRHAAEPDRKYPIRGQILGIGAPRQDGRRDLSLKHEDIPGFMPAMSMAYTVKQASTLDRLAPGDLITATLVLAGRDMYLEGITKTGHAPLPPDAKPVKAMDLMDPGDVVPDDPLTDQEGRTRKLSEWRGRPLAVTFVYTRCPVPDFCPLMDRRFSDLQRAIAADPRLRDRAHLVSVSFDPAHDTPEVIAAHAKARGADPRTWSYLTGTREAVDHLTSRFGVSAIDEADAAQTITHNLRTAIVDPKGRLVKIYSGNEWTVDALLADLREADGR